MPPNTTFCKCFALLDHDLRIPDVRHLGLRLLAAENWHATTIFFSGVIQYNTLFHGALFSRVVIRDLKLNEIKVDIVNFILDDYFILSLKYVYCLQEYSDQV